MSTKFFVGVLLIAEISCVWTFVAQDIGLQNGQIYSTSVEWICTSDADCTTAGSSCVNQKCQCPSEYVFNAAMTACLRAAMNYGDSCEETAQCTAYLKAGGICNKNRCICSKGYHYVHGQCRKSAGLNQKCRTDDDCYVNSDFGAFSCKNETCVCRDGYYQREYRTCRLEATESGAECTIDMDCTYDKNARCDKKSAKCYVQWGNETTIPVLRGSDYEAPKTFQNDVFGLDMVSRKGCTSDEVCAVLGEALCDSRGMCACKPGYFFDPKTPRCNAEIGEKCAEGDTNIIMNSKCRFGRWSCMGATVPSKNNRICREATTIFDDYCFYDEECYVFGPDAFCTFSKCACSRYSHYSDKNKFCWVNKLIGDECLVDEDCHEPRFHSQLTCDSEFGCACPKGTHLNAVGSDCVKDIPILGDRCSRSEDCKGLKNAGCSKGYCSCEPHYFEMAGECVNGYFAPCEIDDDCKTEHSMCHEKRCGCADPYVPAATDLCVQGVAFGGYCQLDAECEVNTTESYCNSVSKCDCHEKYHYHGTRCSKIKGFDDKCDYSIDICWDETWEYPDSMECNIDTCRCKHGYIPSYNWIYCYPQPELPNSASKNIFLGYFGLIIFSTRFIGLL